MKFKLLVVFVWILCLKVTKCSRTGIAVFGNPETGLNGTVTLRSNPVFGTFLIGQIRNIVCNNSTSAIRRPLQGPPLNNCMLGLTINNWRANGDETKSRPNLKLESNLRQTIFNLSNIKFDKFKEIFSETFKPISNLFNPSTISPVVDDRFREMTCFDIGDIYNPHRDIMSGPLGFISPPGILGNLVVTNGTGSIMMGPLELLTAGRPSVYGLPLVIWMDSIKPEVNGTTIALKTGPNDRILDCAPIIPLLQNTSMVI